MTERMRECLERAVRERAQAAGNRAFSPRLLQISFRLGADGFQRSTVWRALELATEEETTDAPR